MTDTDPTQHVIDAIDGQLGDCTVSGDAMRWTPDPPPVPPDANWAVGLPLGVRIAAAHSGAVYFQSELNGAAPDGDRASRAGMRALHELHGRTTTARPPRRGLSHRKELTSRRTTPHRWTMRLITAAASALLSYGAAKLLIHGRESSMDYRLALLVAAVLGAIAAVAADAIHGRRYRYRAPAIGVRLPRTELRESNADGSNAAWDPNTGTHTLPRDATERGCERCGDRTCPTIDGLCEDCTAYNNGRVVL